jgi:hypothetical protein
LRCSSPSGALDLELIGIAVTPQMLPVAPM